jgi:Ca-activated chloride channel homolog
MEFRIVNELPHYQTSDYLNSASPLCPLSASGVGKDEVRGEAKAIAKLRGIMPAGIRKTLTVLAWSLTVVLMTSVTHSLAADELHSKNKEAAKHYDKGNYDEALKSYDNLILEFPQEPKLKMNKGSVQYKLGNFDKADESYNAATSTKDKKALADLYYNLGNTQYMQADRMASQGDNKAMDKYKAALENYIKSLDIRPSDKDAKWNVQLTQKKMKQMQQQQQNNKDNKQNKDNKDQNKDNQQQNKKDQNQDKNKQDQNKDQKKQDDKKQDQRKKDNQQQNDKDQNQDKQKPEPSPQQQKQDDMKKDEAKRLIEQFSDDEKDLNKKPEKIGVLKNKNVEKDW